MCEGDCKIQFYDVDISQVVATPFPDNPAGCPKQPLEDDIADALQPYNTVIGCKETDCECIPTSDPMGGWTEFVAYDVPAGKQITVLRQDLTTCNYSLSGTYYVSSAIQNGVCMKKPKDFKPYPRRKSSAARPKKAGEKGADKTKKKVGPKKESPKKEGPKKEGPKTSRPHRTVRRPSRPGRRGSALG